MQEPETLVGQCTFSIRVVQEASGQFWKRTGENTILTSNLATSVLEQHTSPWVQTFPFSKAEELKCDEWSWRGGAKDVYIPPAEAREGNM
jgi:hypothetical protein